VVDAAVASVTKSAAAGPFAGKNKFKTVAVLLVVAVSALFLVRTILAARKKKMSKQTSKDAETQQWQSFFASSEPPPPPPSPLPYPAPPQHVPRHHAHAPAEASVRRPTNIPPGDSGTMGGRPTHTMQPQSTRPQRDTGINAPPPADVAPKVTPGEAPAAVPDFTEI